jgi:CheY-like chemotaxis protein
MNEKTFTTYQIAKFCDVYPSSVINWINDGKLKAFVTPGGHHRVLREELLRFLNDCGIPLPEGFGGDARKRILIVDDDAEMARLIAKAFARHPEAFATEVLHSGVDALIRIGCQVPHLMVLDIVLPKMDGCQVCRILKSRPETSAIKIVGISGKKYPLAEKKLAEYQVDAFYRKPLDLAELVAKAALLLKVELSPVGRPAARD